MLHAHVRSCYSEIEKAVLGVCCLGCVAVAHCVCDKKSVCTADYSICVCLSKLDILDRN